MFLDVQSSVYNLIITANNKDRDAYFHPVSRLLIQKRFELEYEIEMRASTGFMSWSSPICDADAITMRIKCRSSNAVAGYASRVTEELIARKKTLSLSSDEVKLAVASFESTYNAEYAVNDIAKHMTDKTQEERMLFILFLQDDNKHTAYFLDESLWERWFGTLLQTNIDATIGSYKEYVQPRTEALSEEVLNDTVFGYCVRLSESLFPITR
jgi:hypothetical protein